LEGYKIKFCLLFFFNQKFLSDPKNKIFYDLKSVTFKIDFFP